MQIAGNLPRRRVIALEETLGTTLVERTTRHLSLTEAGRLYQERAKEILEEVAEAERGLTVQTGVASGRLYVSAPSLLGRRRLSPMLPTFLAEQTQVSIDLMLADRPIRLTEEGIDVALRIGPLEDSGLIARKLDDIQLVEHPFGTLKMRMGATHFLMKRLPKVATEMALHVLAYNLTRVMNVMGIQPLIAAMRA
jgi:DNA-binding transcriptional LysR family regulator